MGVLVLGLDPTKILNSLSPYGELGVLLIVFAETGLLLGFFLPGDSLLFAAGLLANQGKMNLALVIGGCFVAAVLGDQVAFTFGQRLGPSLMRRPDSRFYKREHLEKTEAFFARHGPKTVLFARFVPVVRTFAPLLAGVGRMSRRTFLSYNVVGAFIWVVGVTMAGFLLGNVIGTSIDQYLLPIVLVVVLVSLVPSFFEWRATRKQPPASSGR